MRNERRGSLAYPDCDQATAFHRALMQRLGTEAPEAADDVRLRATLERAQQAAQQQRGDIITLAASLLFGIIRDRPFGKQSVQTGSALTLAFLLRNGVAVVAPQEEVAGVALAIAQGEIYTAMVEMWLRDSVRPLRE